MFHKIRATTRSIVLAIAAGLVVVGSGSSAIAQTQTTYATGVGRPASLSFNAAAELFVGNFDDEKVFKVAPGGGAASNYITSPYYHHDAIIGPDNALYVVDQGGNVWRYAPGSTVVDATPYATGFPTGSLASIVFGSDGRLFGTAVASTQVLVASSSGGFAAPFATGLVNPTDLAVDAANNIYALERETGQVKRVGTGGGAFSGFSTGNNFNGVSNYGLAIDANGNVYTSTLANSIIRITPATGGASSVYFTLPQDALLALTFRNGVLYAGGYNTGNVYAVTTIPAVVTPVPTMTEWAMILFVVMLAGSAVVMLQRRQMSA